MSVNLGYSTAPSSGVWTDQRSASTQFWITDSFAMPAGGGVVTNFQFYARSVSGTTAVTCCIWLGTTLMWSGSTGIITTMMQWNGKAVPSVYVGAGNVFLGFWAAGTLDLEWEVAPNGTNGGVQAQAVGSASNRGSSTDAYGGQGFGCFGCYITYTPGGIVHAERSSAWANSQAINGRRSNAWSSAQGIVRWKSGAWQEAT